MPRIKTFRTGLRYFGLQNRFGLNKGQIKPYADLHAVDSPKKRTNKFVLFFKVKSKKAKSKNHSFIRFLGESRARQSAFGFI